MRSEPDETVLSELAARVGLESKGAASDADIDRIEQSARSQLPTLFAAFLRRFNGCQNAVLEFDGDVVLFDSAADILLQIEISEIEGAGAVPFAHDFFGSLWLLMLRPGVAGFEPGRVDFMPVQERYVDPDNPIEHRAASFEVFLRGLAARTR